MIGDDGKGVAEAKLHSNGMGLGISGMKQRVKEFGGELRVRNAKPGTIIEAVLPVELDS